MKIIIIGGVAGGAGVATRIKRLCEDCEVLVIEKGEYVSFANCGLPYHISNTIPNRSQLILQSPESLKKRSDINVRTSHEVIEISTMEKTLQIRDLNTNQIYQENYDYLVLATGSKAMVPNISGIDDPLVKTLQTIPDMDTIISVLKDSPKHVAIIGGGFIGLEAAENILEAGHQVSIIERSSQLMTSLDPEMSLYIEDELKEHGAQLYFQQNLNKIEKIGNQLELHLDNSTLRVDLVILSAGVLPNSDLAKKSGLTLNERGAIIVDQNLKTSDPYIYAVGDVIETFNIVSETRSSIPLAGPATRQARIVAENILGGNKIYKGFNPTSICKIFSTTVASTGLNEKQLQGQKYHKVYVHPSNHPGYFPESYPIHIKLLYNDEGIVLGAQVVGTEGVDKRIDIFALAVRQKLSVYDLSEQDFAYAPPFGSPRDPVHVASFAAINQLEGLSNPVFDKEIENSILLDVREKSEVQINPVIDAIHIPLGDLRLRYTELDSSKKIIVMCASGLRSYLAERFLKQKGFDTVNFSGGFSCLKMHR